jgi:hypothetical protein
MKNFGKTMAAYVVTYAVSFALARLLRNYIINNQ